MTSYDSVKDFILTTDANTSKNFQTQIYTFSSALVSVPNNSFVLRSFAIALSEETRIFNILFNMSDESSTYYPVDRFERRTLVGTGIKSWATQLTASGNTATLSIFLVNGGTGSSINFAAFDVNIIRRDFVDEI